MAARLTPGSRLAISVAPVSRAPVEPALTSASPSPAASSRSATTIDESFLCRTAEVGSSHISMVSAACFTVMPAISMPFSRAQAPIFSSSPTAMISTPSSFTAAAAPSNSSFGALSPPMASKMIFMLPSSPFVRAGGTMMAPCPPLAVFATLSAPSARPGCAGPAA